MRYWLELRGRRVGVTTARALIEILEAHAMSHEHGEASAPVARKNDSLILESLTRIEANQANLLIKLFGDTTGETEHGRIPRLEARADSHSSRIQLIERFIISVTAGSVVLWGAFKVVMTAVEIGARR